MTNEVTKSKATNKIEYVNKVELTVTLKEAPKLKQFQQKVSVSAITLEVANAQASWNGLNFTTISAYDPKIKERLLKLKERDIIFIKGKLHNRYYPNKINNKTFFSIEVLFFEKVGKAKKK